MIKVDSISIKEFRGIRDMTLDFKGSNFAVCGPNGTGKSGVVDALEFALTGKVSRLSGEGSGDVSLKQHGPHVDSRNAPKQACVTVEVRFPALKTTASITRTVHTPTAPQINPSDPITLAILRNIESHPEVVLSRRELIRYVLATPGQRSAEVQALLNIETIEKVRSGLQKIANGAEKTLKTLTDSATESRTHLLRALGIDGVKTEKMLSVVNPKRAILGLAPLLEISETVSLREGIATKAKTPGPGINKAQALADIKTAREVLSGMSTPETIAQVSEATLSLKSLTNDPLIAVGINRGSFYSTALTLIDSEECPLCDTPWDPALLKQRLQNKIEQLKEASRKRKEAETKLVPLIAQLRTAKITIESLVRTANQTKPPTPSAKLSGYALSCANTINSLEDFLPLSASMERLAEFGKIAQDFLDELSTMEGTISALPDPSEQDAARDWLTIAQERLDVWREAMRKLEGMKVQAQLAKKVCAHFGTTSDQVLNGIYADVEKEFARFYRFVNRTDEDKFQAKLAPSLGKLGFDVDFYGRGFFPPGAYHSEGHQDSMGLCLYLALMRHLHGSGFTFAVLDDVLMSVDAGHRRELCALLKQEFPETQFVMTTHDPIWLRHMKTEQLIGSGSSLQFRNWNVESGPVEWDGRDIWTEIDDALKSNNVRDAAGILRNYLEYVASELCHRLRAPVEYRGDAQYQLGELLPSAISRLGRLYGEAKDAATSWGQKSVVDQLDESKKQFTVLANTSRAEQWQTNAAIHYNSWDNLGQADFAPVVTAFKNLLEGFSCKGCNGLLRVTPDRNSREALRCDCGAVNLNLKRK